MYKLGDVISVSNQVTITSLGYEVNQDYLLNSFREDLSTGRYSTSYKVLKLKNNTELVPIVSALNSRSRILTVPRDRFINNELVNISSLLMGSSKVETLDKVKDEIIVNLTATYDAILNMNANDFSSNIFIGAANQYISNPTVDTQQRILTSRNNTNYSILGENSILGTFYYTYNDKILLTLMVKKEFIDDFKKNLMDGVINPTHCEIWIDKILLDEKERKKLHKWIKDVFLMKLVMNGFKIVEKDDIIAELVYFPKIRFRSPSEISEFKTGINKLVFDE